MKIRAIRGRLLLEADFFNHRGTEDTENTSIRSQRSQSGHRVHRARQRHAAALRNAVLTALRRVNSAVRRMLPEQRTQRYIEKGLNVARRVSGGMIEVPIRVDPRNPWSDRTAKLFNR